VLALDDQVRIRQVLALDDQVRARRVLALDDQVHTRRVLDDQVRTDGCSHWMIRVRAPDDQSTLMVYTQIVRRKSIPQQFR